MCYAVACNWIWYTWLQTQFKFGVRDPKEQRVPEKQDTTCKVRAQGRLCVGCDLENTHPWEGNTWKKWFEHSKSENNRECLSLVMICIVLDEMGGGYRYLLQTKWVPHTFTWDFQKSNTHVFKSSGGWSSRVQLGLWFTSGELSVCFKAINKTK